ncbi:MAG: hypothetical protein L0Z62_47585 [Gemmataceae bacterium]|nr:hypothetical protein [Gemmataceae bacterium]
MRSALGLGLAALLLGGAAGRAQDTPKDTYDSLVKETIDTLKQTVVVLKSVKDKQSAGEATPKLKKLGGQLQDVRKRLDRLGKPSAEQQAELQKKYGKELTDGLGALRLEAVRVQSVEGGPEALQGLSPVKPPPPPKDKDKPEKDKPKKDDAKEKRPDR